MKATVDDDEANDEGDELAIALQRDAELEANPEMGLTWEQFRAAIARDCDMS